MRVRDTQSFLAGQPGGGNYTHEWNGSTCVAIGPHHAICCAHEQGTTATIINGFPDSGNTLPQYTVKTITVHQTADLQILEIDGTFPEWATLAPSNPAIGDTITIGARGRLGNNQDQTLSGRILHFGTNKCSYADADIIEIIYNTVVQVDCTTNEVECCTNDSGGGYFDSQMRLLGIVANPDSGWSIQGVKAWITSIIMAAPTVSSYSWNPTTLVLTITWSESVSKGSTWAAAGIQLTDQNSRIFTNPNQLVTAGGTQAIQMVEGGAINGPPGSIDIAAGTFKNGTNDDNLAIANDPFYSPVNEGTSGLTRNDVNVLRLQITQATTGGIDLTADPQKTNFNNVNGTMLTYLLGAPCVFTLAGSVLDAYDKYQLSSKDAGAEANLRSAVNTLRANLQQHRGRWALTSTGT